MKSLQLLALSSLLCTGLVLAQTTPATTTKSAAKTAAPKTTAASAPSAADIANAKAKGMVWANNSSKVYHPSSDKEYGTTLQDGRGVCLEVDCQAGNGRSACHGSQAGLDACSSSSFDHPCPRCQDGCHTSASS